MIMALLGVSRARPADTDTSDEALLARFAEGEDGALGELFDRHHAGTYRFLARLTGARDADLDDLVQATFIEVARGASRFDGRSAVRTWLFGIALNVARHYKRGAARRRRVLVDADGERPSQVPGRERPDETAEQRELLVALERAIDELPPALREAFVASEVEDLPGKDVARLLGIPEGTLFRRLHDARKLLRTALGRTT